MVHESIRSCCDDTAYALVQQKSRGCRGLSGLFAEQLPARGRVEILLFPEAAQPLQAQIIREATAMMELDDERLLMPIDVVIVETLDAASADAGSDADSKTLSKQIGLVYPLEQRISINRIFEKYEHAFTETAAVKICSNILELLHVLHSHEYGLGGIDGDTIQILGRKQVQIGPIVPEVCKSFLAPARDLLQTEHHVPQDMDAMDDIYGVAILLLCFLQKNLWALGGTNKTTQSFVKQEGLQGYIDTIPDVSDETIAFLNQALHTDRRQRYQSAQMMLIDLGRSLAGLSLRIVKQQPSADPSLRSDLYNTEDIQEHIKRKPMQPVSPVVAIDKKRLKALSRLVVLDAQELTARINLAPGTSFPRDLLLRLLEEAGVTYGIDAAALNQATISVPEARRIVLARGDSAHPGRPGKGVRGKAIGAPNVAISIEIIDDGMCAVAHSVPKQKVVLDDIKNALNIAEVSFGIDQGAIANLVNEGSATDGITVVARGRPRQPGRPGAYVAQNENADLVRKQLVKRSNIVAVWEPGLEAQSGTRVNGDRLSASAIARKQHSELAGEGVEIHREKDHIVLRAKTDGLMQIADDGVVSVVGIKEIYNKVGAGDHIDCDEAVIIYGSVLKGAKINSRSAIQIEGDVGDAEIISCGDLEVSGEIRAGLQQIQVAGVLQAQSITGRSVLAQKVLITGDIINAQVVSLSDVRARAIIDSNVTAAANIHCVQAGNAAALPVTLWAGHHVPTAIKRDIAQLQEKRLSSERVRMVKERNSIVQDVGLMKQQEYRFKVSGFMKEDHLLLLQDRIAQIKARGEYLQGALEDARHVLVDHKEQVQDLNEDTDNRKAMVQVEHAYAGISVKVSDSATRQFTREEHAVIHRLQ